MTELLNDAKKTLSKTVSRRTEVKWGRRQSSKCNILEAIFDVKWIKNKTLACFFLSYFSNLLQPLSHPLFPIASKEHIKLSKTRIETHKFNAAKFFLLFLYLLIYSSRKFLLSLAYIQQNWCERDLYGTCATHTQWQILVHLKKIFLLQKLFRVK